MAYLPNGREIQRIEIPLLRHPHADQMNVLLMLLLIFSVLALVLSGVLTANLMAAMMAKQTRQVGVMKAVGASVWQVTRIYASGILIISVASVALGIPLGTIAGRAYAAFAAEQLNLAIGSYAVPVWLFGLIALFGVGVPLFSALRSNLANRAKTDSQNLAGRRNSAAEQAESFRKIL